MLLKGAGPGVIERPCNGLSSWSHLSPASGKGAIKSSSVKTGKIDEIKMRQQVKHFSGWRKKGFHFISALAYGFSQEGMALCLFSSTSSC